MNIRFMAIISAVTMLASCALGFFKGKGKKDIEPKVKTSGAYEVLIPEERLVAASMSLDGKPYVCVLNEAIMELTPKEPFQWYLSLIMVFGSTVGQDLPDREDTVRMQDFIDDLCESLAADKNHPNAVFLGRVTGNGETHAMWYVNNPDKANDLLQSLIKSGKYPFNFEFVMEPDPDWEEAHFWLDPLKNKLL